MMLLHGDCLDTLKTLEDNSIDSVVTDPPYGLAFMGKRWDYSVPSVDIWREVLRVLKPGGHVLSFCGTRTYHRMVVNMEDAGFEIRDQIQWIYGSGFPKSHDISKGIDKQAGAEREVVGPSARHGGGSSKLFPERGSNPITAPSTDLAKKAQGWGTALKPANEPICLARKPLIGTVAKNFAAFGVGGLNIDASRIGRKEGDRTEYGVNGDELSQPAKNTYGEYNRQAYVPDNQGRWPANVLFDETAAEMLDEQSGQLHLRGNKKETTLGGGMYGHGTFKGVGLSESGHAGASRFFYCAKASKSERNAWCDDLPEVVKRGQMTDSNWSGDKSFDGKPLPITKNSHPTVKPLKLMQYLVTLITPPGGVVLDPFMGSGSTGVAAKSLGFQFIGCELSEEYLAIAERRIKHQEGEAV